jgi:hypothetical protein
MEASTTAGTVLVCSLQFMNRDAVRTAGGIVTRLGSGKLRKRGSVPESGKSILFYPKISE